MPFDIEPAAQENPGRIRSNFGYDYLGEDRDYLKRCFPAIFAEEPSEKMSAKYNFMPTHKLADFLVKELEMVVVAASQQRSLSRDPSHQEHTLRFRLPGLDQSELGDAIPEMVLFNSHNGRTTARLYMGVFRVVCSNGMVVMSESYGAQALRHAGIDSAYQQLEAAANKMGEGYATLAGRIERLRETRLTKGKELNLAGAMIEARGISVDDRMPFLEGQRESDGVFGNRTGWQAFNVLQENLTRSTIQYVDAQGKDRSTREIKGVARDVSLNGGLWGAMESVLEAA